MFSKTLTALTFVVALTLQVNAHAGITPALGVSGTFARGNVQRPSTASPCGNINIAQNIDTSTPVAAAANGQFTVTVTNFNAGADGSRQVSATVDATGTGKSFAGAVTISKNGDPAPTSTGSDQVVASLPAGTTCSGGTAGNLCLVSFKTSAGFGDCVVVQQGAAAGGAGNATAATQPAATKAGKGAAAANATQPAAANAGTNAAATTNNGTATNGATTKKHHHHKNANAANANANGAAVAARNIGGTRLARALRYGEDWMLA